MFKSIKLNIDTNRGFFALMREVDAMKLGLKSGDRIKVFPTKDDSRSIICELEILGCTEFKCDVSIKKEELGIFAEAYHKLELKPGERICVLPAEKPKSLNFVRDKFDGKIRLNQNQCDLILKDIVSNNFSVIETTYFVLACTANPLNDEEVIHLTKAMVNVGKHLDFRNKSSDKIMDKHCIGGIPGNRTTMLVIPIVAAAGLTIPKTSSRSITSPSGTADTMEALCSVSISPTEMFAQVRDIGACIAWGGAVDLSPADDIIINVEHPLEIDSEGQMIASILSKKKSAGSTHVLLDIPIGQTAKVKNRKDGERLKRRFEKVGKALKMDVRVIITDGAQPIGRGIGPSLEAEDVMRVLKNDKAQPKRLRKKSIEMAGYLLEMGGVSKKGYGQHIAEEILSSGRALKKMQEIIEHQGAAPKIKQANHVDVIKAEKSGKITKIHNKRIAKVAFILGAPKGKEAGIYIHKIIGDTVKKGETIYEIHSNSKLKLKYGKTYSQENEIFTIR